ncbi:MAG: hypothetical protein KF819_17040 [Labilithrix sp.]|nr:hypothetical protein [Labilithrix sp.]
MGFSVRSLVVLALVVVPAVASAQGASPPPPGGGAPPPGGAAPAEPAGAAAAAPEKAEPKTPAAGYAYSDKPAARRAPVGRAVVRRAGPQATFPGFEQLPDGGSRLFVQLTQQVPVEQRNAPGAVTFVLKGAHVRTFNDTNALVTVHFNTPVSRARLVPKGNDLLFIVDLRAASPATFKFQDNQDKTATLMIDFGKGDFAASTEEDGVRAVKATRTDAPKTGGVPPASSPGPTP